MAQTVGEFSAVNAKVETSPDNSVWTDISGTANKIEPDGGNRQSGEVYTFEGDTGLITGGKREPIDLKLSFVYTEVGGEAWLNAEQAYENGTPFYVRYSPGGGNSGDQLFTSLKGLITEFMYPTADTEEAKAIIGEMTVRVPALVRSTVA